MGFKFGVTAVRANDFATPSSWAWSPRSEAIERPAPGAGRSSSNGGFVEDPADLARRRPGRSCPTRLRELR